MHGEYVCRIHTHLRSVCTEEKANHNTCPDQQDHWIKFSIGTGFGRENRLDLIEHVIDAETQATLQTFSSVAVFKI